MHQPRKKIVDGNMYVCSLLYIYFEISGFYNWQWNNFQDGECVRLARIFLTVILKSDVRNAQKL